MTTLQRQARALGDPTRHQIFQYIAAASGAVDVAQLTAHLSLNHNAIRQHLAKLVGAGLIEEDKEGRTSPGRPRLVYRLAPNADSKWGAVGPYERLSGLLAEIIRSGKSPSQVGRELGRRMQTTAGTYASAAAGIADTMDRQGFEPVIVRGKSSTDIVLQTCPFASTALVDRATVCSLHLGFAEGLAEGNEVRIEKLVARDPRTAQCRLRIRPASGTDTGSGELVLLGRRRAAN